MSLTLRTVAAELLKPAAYNPRKPLRKGSPGYRRLARSLSEFGLVQPIVWNERTGTVVGGHQRLQVLLDEGASAVEVAVVDLPVGQEKALNVALNNANVGSEWDDAKLVSLLGELAALPDFDATMTGFDAGDLSDLLLVPDPEPAPPPELEPDADRVRVSFNRRPRRLGGGAVASRRTAGRPRCRPARPAAGVRESCLAIRWLTTCYGKAVRSRNRKRRARSSSVVTSGL